MSLKIVRTHAATGTHWPRAISSGHTPSHSATRPMTRVPGIQIVPDDQTTCCVSPRPKKWILNKQSLVHSMHSQLAHFAWPKIP